MGVLRRRTAVATRKIAAGESEARAVVEDDFHHFRVTILSRNGHVEGTSTQSLRTPTMICGQAGQRLTELEGMALDPASASVLKHTDARLQCTHMIDLAGLAVAALSQGTPFRQYDAEVDDKSPDRTRRARLRRNGVLVLEWELDGYAVKGPPPYSGLSLGAGFTGWTQDMLPTDDAEAALVLRRAIFISNGRTVDLDAPGRRTGPFGGCWAWQPERADKALRNVGSTQDFTDRPDALLEEDQTWLDFSRAD